MNNFIKFGVALTFVSVAVVIIGWAIVAILNNGSEYDKDKINISDDQKIAESEKQLLILNIKDENFETYKIYINSQIGLFGLDSSASIQSKSDLRSLFTTTELLKNVCGTMGFFSRLSKIGAKTKVNFKIKELNNQFFKRSIAEFYKEEKLYGGYEVPRGGMVRILKKMSQLVTVTPPFWERLNYLIRFKLPPSVLIPVGALNKKIINCGNINFKRENMSGDTESKTINSLQYYGIDVSDKNLQGLAAYREVYGAVLGTKMWLKENNYGKLRIVSDSEILKEINLRRLIKERN